MKTRWLDQDEEHRVSEWGKVSLSLDADLKGHLQRMLAAPGPARFDDACGSSMGDARASVAAPAPGGDSGEADAYASLHTTPHQAKQDASVRVLRCAWGATITPQLTPATRCTVVSMNRIATSAVANAARAAGLRARRRRRRMGTFALRGAPTPIGGTNATTSSSSSLAAAIRGECSEDETLMCTRALEHGGVVGRTDHRAEAELCVLRAADDPL